MKGRQRQRQSFSVIRVRNGIKGYMPHVTEPFNYCKSGIFNTKSADDYGSVWNRDPTSP